MCSFPNQPTGSVILVASAGAESVTKTLRALAAQNIAHQLEIVVAARPDQVEGLRQLNASAFFAINVVPSDFTTSAIARASAIWAAEADILLLVEDHSFPTTSDWAERLIRAHDAGHVAVGPRMENANPASATSWANFLIEYGQWADVSVAGEALQLPGHNSSYKTEALRRYGDDLAHLMETEWVLHNRMREDGETLWIEPEVSTAHVNFSKFGSAAKLHYLEGRLFAASRSEHWGPVQRGLFAGGFPLIFLVRLFRIIRLAVGRGDTGGTILAGLPVLLTLLWINSWGEAVGYVLGEGDKKPQLGVMEYDRWQYIRDVDAEILT